MAIISNKIFKDALRICDIASVDVRLVLYVPDMGNLLTAGVNVFIFRNSLTLNA
jgi:hypothetical protein